MKLLLAICLVVTFANVAVADEPILPPPSEARLAREVETPKQVIDEIRAANDSLKGLEAVTISHYAWPEKAEEPLVWYRRQASLKGLVPLVAASGLLDDAAAWASADGKVLFSVHKEPWGLVTTAIRGPVSLEAMPTLKSALIQAAGRRKHHWLRRGPAPPEPPAYKRHIAAGKTAIKAGDDKAAEAAFRKASAVLPGRATPFYYIGRVHEKGNRLKEATSAYEAAAQLAPHWVSVQLRLGDVFAAQGQREQAKLHYQRALDLHPKSEAARKGLESLATKGGKR